MSCIVACTVKESGERGCGVLLKSDTVGTGRSTQMHYVNPKIFSVPLNNGAGQSIATIGLGVSGSWRVGQVAQQALSDWRTTETPDTWTTSHTQQYVIQHIIPVLRNALEDVNCISNDSTSENKGARMLLGLCGTLMIIQRDFSVLIPQNGIAAIGSGFQYARGAMHAHMKEGSVFHQQTYEIDEASALLDAGLDAAIHNHPNVAGSTIRILAT